MWPLRPDRYRTRFNHCTCHQKDQGSLIPDRRIIRKNALVTIRIQRFVSLVPRKNFLVRLNSAKFAEFGQFKSLTTEL